MQPDHPGAFNSQGLQRLPGFDIWPFKPTELHSRKYSVRTPMTQERRRFSRIDFDARVELAQGGTNWQAQLLDISLKGVLLAKLGHYHLPPTAPLLVKIILSDQTSIAMTANVVHQTLEQLHLSCATIDIDSISHLRRLIELNIGDATAAERELTELIADALS
jgi:hypothetical protein